ncbi:MAG: TfoX/Sxy family protein [Candidatus Limnocylindrales bacterium]
MTYDLALAERIRASLPVAPEATERAMFGGLAFLIQGNIAAVASSRGGLMIRADPSTTAGLVETTPAEWAEMRGRRMQSWLRLTSADLGSDADLARWIELAVRYAATLPPKI